MGITMRKKLASLILAFILLSVSSVDSVAVSANGFALVETATGRMLAGQNTDKKMPMASTTKIMTGLLACESGQFDTVCTVPPEAVRVEGSSMGLLPGEKITLRDLTYGLLLESGNDAANAIAYVLDGSITAFADRMNRRAAEIGLTNTHFSNPSGLDDKEHYTTALDLARLGACAMKNEDFARIASTYKAYATYNGAKNGRVLVNHNALLKTYSGAIGIKTGYTRKSGRCLVSCAERDGISLVCATLSGPDDWNDHRALLDYGFTQLKILPVFPDPPSLSAKVVSGIDDTVACSYRMDLTAALRGEEQARLKTQIFMPRFLYAPVIQGQTVGEIVVTLDGIELARTGIVAEQTVGVGVKPSLRSRLYDLMHPNAAR